MPWVMLDDQFADHPKVMAAGPAASWLYVCGLTYCARYLTDGFIPAAQVRKLADVDNAQALAGRLVDVALWHETDGGYVVHDYLTYNPSAEKVRAERAAAKTRMQQLRSPEVRPNNARTNAEVRSPRPPSHTHTRTPSPYGDPDTHTSPPTPSARVGVQIGDGTGDGKPDTAASALVERGLYDSFAAVLDVRPLTEIEQDKWQRGCRQLARAGIAPPGVVALVRAAEATFSPQASINPLSIAANLTKLTTLTKRGNPNGTHSPRSEPPAADLEARRLAKRAALIAAGVPVPAEPPAATNGAHPA